MDAIAEEARLPTDIDTQPVVRAAAAMRPKLRDYKHQVETEQRLPPELVEEFRAAGFYSLVMPRSMGGLQADPLTYQRVVELLAEGLGSAGWNVANNGVGQLITLGYPDEGVREIYANGADTILAGTAVPGGGTAVPVDGGYRVTGRWSFGSGCQEAAWMTGSFAIPDRGPGYWRGTFARHEVTVVPGSWEVTGMRGTGSFDWTVEDLFVPERRVMVHVGAPLDNQWAHWPGITYAMPKLRLGRPAPLLGVDRYCPCGDRRADRAGGGKGAAWPREFGTVVRQRPGAGGGGPGGLDAHRRADLSGRDDPRTMGHNRVRRRNDAGTACPVPSGGDIRRRLRARCDGPDVPAGWQHVVQAGKPLGGVLARPACRRANGQHRPRVVPARRTSSHGDGPGAQAAVMRIVDTQITSGASGCQAIIRQIRSFTAAEAKAVP